MNGTVHKLEFRSKINSAVFHILNSNMFDKAHLPDNVFDGSKAFVCVTLSGALSTFCWKISSARIWHYSASRRSCCYIAGAQIWHIGFHPLLLFPLFFIVFQVRILICISARFYYSSTWFFPHLFPWLPRHPPLIPCRSLRHLPCLSITF